MQQQAVPELEKQYAADGGVMASGPAQSSHHIRADLPADSRDASHYDDPSQRQLQQVFLVGFNSPTVAGTTRSVSCTHMYA